MTTTPISIRDTEAYKNLDSYMATGLAEGFEEGTQEEQLAAWQFLHDKGIAYRLQGWFGRTAQHLISEGHILA